MIESHTSCYKVSDAGICHFCYSNNIIKNGRTKTGKQQYHCKSCKKRFLDFYTYQAYYPQIDERIIQLTREGLGISSTARVLKISKTTLLKRLITIAGKIKHPVISKGKIYEVDEMRFFIRNKKNTMWLVYALDRATKRVAGFFIGKRNNLTLKAVIKTLVNGQAKKIYTDKLKNYSFIIPKEIHSTERYGTNQIERYNLTIRTNVKRLNRRTICWSRSITILTAILKIYFWDNSCNI